MSEKKPLHQVIEDKIDELMNIKYGKEGTLREVVIRVVDQLDNLARGKMPVAEAHRLALKYDHLPTMFRASGVVWTLVDQAQMALADLHNRSEEKPTVIIAQGEAEVIDVLEGEDGSHTRHGEGEA